MGETHKDEGQRQEMCEDGSEDESEGEGERLYQQTV